MKKYEYKFVEVKIKERLRANAGVNHPLCYQIIFEKEAGSKI